MSVRPYKEFVQKYLGKRADADGLYGYQCVDLIKTYCHEMFCMRIKKTGNANELRENKYKFFGKQRYPINGTDDLMQGDIIFSLKGEYGHVAIVDHYAGGKIYVLEQNGSGKNSGSGTGDNAIRVKDYSKKFRVGVWRFMGIFENLQKERLFCEDKIIRLKSDLENTEAYYKTTRYLKGDKTRG